MFKILGKKKLSENKLANVFVNSVLDAVDKGFPEVAAIINEDPEFEKRPNIPESASDVFLLIVIAGNIKLIPQYFESGQDTRLTEYIIEKFSKVFGVEKERLYRTIDEYHRYFVKVNHPSKNTLYAMSKAIFYKYELNNCQKDYFRKINAPNPIFLKRMDEIVESYVWDWEGFKEKYQIVQ